jgi:hypothetical protein
MSGIVGTTMLQRLDVSDDFRISVAIDHETSSGQIGNVIPAGAIVYTTLVTVTESWNSSSPSIKIGTTEEWDMGGIRYNEDEAILAEVLVDLRQGGTHVSHRVYRPTEDVNMDLVIDHDGASSGEAIITLLIVPPRG